MTKSTYQPPYTITPEILNQVAAISEAIGRLTVLTDQARSLRLRRINRIRTIHGSLAIEGNTLSEAQITAILEGKRVIAPPREVQEVKNALAAYERFDSWKPESEEDLLEAHRILMSGLIDEAGLYRHGGVGAMAGQQVIHMAPPAVSFTTSSRSVAARWLSRFCGPEAACRSALQMRALAPVIPFPSSSAINMSIGKEI